MIRRPKVAEGSHVKNVGIIGGGASGIMAAITAARLGAQVTIFEHNNRIGKKILATGNGKCNFSNLNQDENSYFSEQMSFPEQILKQFTPLQSVDFFESIGMLIKVKNDYLYPATMQASTVLDLLNLELEKQKVVIVTDIQITDIRKNTNKDGFLIQTAEKNWEMDRIILCCGSKASPKTGSDGSGYRLAEKFGHNIVKPLPALVQVKCKENFFKIISGVRTLANVSLYINGALKDSDLGELQLTDYGISGIPVFQISRHISRSLEQKEKLEVFIDFFPDITNEHLQLFLENRKNMFQDRTIEEFFCGIMQKKLTTMILKEYNMAPSRKIRDISLSELEKLFIWIKKFPVKVIGTNSFDQAQICMGGVSVDKIDTKMQSKIVSDLYFAGEIVDVDGKCGGYNLQWAWSSGYVAGMNAAK